MKIQTLETFLPLRAQLRERGKKLVCTNGCFDLVHSGHLQSLSMARECGDVLLVLLNADVSVQSLKTPDRPLVKQNERAKLLAGLSVVDYVIIFDEPRCDQILAAVQPDIYVKGADYTLATIDQDERCAVEKNGGRIEFLPLVAGVSTSNLIKKIRRSDPEKILCAAFAFVRRDEKLLLVKNRYEDKIRWGIPGGGQLRGESLTQTVMRETLEETGLSVTINHYIGLLERINSQNIHLLAHQFAVNVLGGEITIRADEEHVIAAEFLTAEQITNLPERVQGREYILRYLRNAEAYPRYAILGDNDE